MTPSTITATSQGNVIFEPGHHPLATAEMPSVSPISVDSSGSEWPGIARTISRDLRVAGYPVARQPFRRRRLSTMSARRNDAVSA